MKRILLVICTFVFQNSSFGVLNYETTLKIDEKASETCKEILNFGSSADTHVEMDKKTSKIYIISVPDWPGSSPWTDGYVFSGSFQQNPSPTPNHVQYQIKDLQFLKTTVDKKSRGVLIIRATGNGLFDKTFGFVSDFGVPLEIKVTDILGNVVCQTKADFFGIWQ